MPQPVQVQFSARHREVAFLDIAKAVGYTQGIVTGVGLFVGIWADVTADSTVGGLFYGLIICMGLAFMLGAGWHVLFKHATEVVSPFIAFVLIVAGLMIFGAGEVTSARFLAAKVDGRSAVQGYENGYLDRLDIALRESERLAAIDRPVINEVAGAERGLLGDLEAEGKFGKISGKVGNNGIVYQTIRNQSGALDDRLKILKGEDARRTELLHGADQHLLEARNAAAEHDEVAFTAIVNRVVQSIREANSINLLDGIAGMSTGLSSDLARGPFENAMAAVMKFSDQAKGMRFQIPVPNFEPLRPKDAVMAFPPIAGWAMASAVEISPLLMLFLLLIGRLIWRRPPED